MWALAFARSRRSGANRRERRRRPSRLLSGQAAFRNDFLAVADIALCPPTPQRSAQGRLEHSEHIFIYRIVRRACSAYVCVSRPRSAHVRARVCLSVSLCAHVRSLRDEEEVEDERRRGAGREVGDDDERERPKRKTRVHANRKPRRLCEKKRAPCYDRLVGRNSAETRTDSANRARTVSSTSLGFYTASMITTIRPSVVFAPIHIHFGDP